MGDLSGVATVANGDCAVVRFSTADYAPSERLEALHEIFGRSLQKVHVEALAGEPFRTAVTLRQMPGLTLYKASRSAAIYRRSRELIEHDDVVVIAGFTSNYEAHHLGRTLNMGRGEGVILTGAEPASFGGPAQNSINLLRVPVRLLSPLVADLEGAYGRAIPANNPALRLLVTYVDILEEAGTFAVPELRRQVVADIHDLIALAIGATRDAAVRDKTSTRKLLRLTRARPPPTSLLRSAGRSRMLVRGALAAAVRVDGDGRRGGRGGAALGGMSASDAQAFSRCDADDDEQITAAATRSSSAQATWRRRRRTGRSAAVGGGRADDIFFPLRRGSTAARADRRRLPDGVGSRRRALAGGQPSEDCCDASVRSRARAGLRVLRARPRRRLHEPEPHVHAGHRLRRVGRGHLRLRVSRHPDRHAT